MRRVNSLVGNRAMVLVVPVLMLAGMACSDAQVKSSIDGYLQNIESAEGQVNIFGKDGRTLTLDLVSEPAIETVDGAAEQENQPSAALVEEEATQIYHASIESASDVIGDDQVAVKKEDGATALSSEDDLSDALADVLIGDQVGSGVEADIQAAIRQIMEDIRPQLMSSTVGAGNVIGSFEGPEATIVEAAQEIERAYFKIEEARTNGKETSAAEHQLEQAYLALIEARAIFSEGHLGKAEEMAEDAEKLASQARMKYLGKSLDEIFETSHNELEPDGDIAVDGQEPKAVSDAVVGEVDDDLSSDPSDAADRIDDVFAKAVQEIERASIKIDEARAEGKETSAAEHRLEQANLTIMEARARLAEGLLEMAEELAEEAEDQASQARMKYLGKSSDEIVTTSVDLLDGNVKSDDPGEEAATSDPDEDVDGDLSYGSSDIGEIDDLEDFVIEGFVASHTSDGLTLEDETVLVINNSTRVDGALSVGVEVRIETARLPDGTLVATRIRTEIEESDQDGELDLGDLKG